MSFSSQEYLDQWKETGKFPAIHDNLFTLIKKRAYSGSVYCDLCGSTGLLGQRLLQVGKVVGVDSDVDAIARGKAAGAINYPHLTAKIEPGLGFDALRAFVAVNGVNTMVARRCISEIFKDRPEWGPIFVWRLAQVGIVDWFIQGRAFSSRSTHPIPNVEEEMAVLGVAGWTKGDTPVVLKEFDSPYRQTAHMRIATNLSEASSLEAYIPKKAKERG